MTKDQIDAIISLGPLIVAAAAGTTTAVFTVIKFFDFQKTRIQEKSVGLTKILKFEEAHAKVLVDMEMLKVTDKQLKEADESQLHKIEGQNIKLEKLDEDYRELVRRVFDFYKGAYSKGS